MALASVELNIEPHPIANLVGELNPWLHAERNQGTQLKGISQGLPGIWLHSWLSSVEAAGSLESQVHPLPVNHFRWKPSISSLLTTVILCVFSVEWWEGPTGTWVSRFDSHNHKMVHSIPSSSPAVFRTLTEGARSLLAAFVFESWLPPVLTQLCTAWKWSTDPCLKLSLPPWLPKGEGGKC